jgi:hypothetical protein
MNHQKVIDLLAPFGQVNIKEDFDETIYTVRRPNYRIKVTFDECSSPLFQGWDNGKLVMETRDDLEACLKAFNA